MSARTDQTWRWLLVATIAGVCSFGSLMAWLFLNVDIVGRERPWPGVTMLEMFGQFFGMIFTSGRVAARSLISRAAGEEVARAGRWRLIPLQFITAVVLICSRFVDSPAQHWSLGHLVSIGFGLLLAIWAIHDAWRFWFRRPQQGELRRG